jgi:release factor glutamine methyltransferase
MHGSYDFFKERLSGFYSESEMRAFYFLLMERCFGLDRKDILTGDGRRLSGGELVALGGAIEDLRLYRPIQYVLGEAEFFGMSFRVNGSVLIPRPETEELVELALDRVVSGVGKVSCLDVGTGSGCIAVALARHIPCSDVHAIEVSEGALAVARENALLHGVCVNFVLHDMMDVFPECLPARFDIIVSNPPYISSSERRFIGRNVLDYEPSLALFAPDGDPLHFYRRIAELTVSHLAHGGRLFLELNPLYAFETKAMIEDICRTKVSLHRDISGKLRFLEAHRTA